MEYIKNILTDEMFIKIILDKVRNNEECKFEYNGCKFITYKNDGFINKIVSYKNDEEKSGNERIIISRNHKKQMFWSLFVKIKYGEWDFAYCSFDLFEIIVDSIKFLYNNKIIDGSDEVIDNLKEKRLLKWKLSYSYNNTSTFSSELFFNPYHYYIEIGDNDNYCFHESNNIKIHAFSLCHLYNIAEISYFENIQRLIEDEKIYNQIEKFKNIKL